MVDPILIVEILSLSTERTDRRLKLPTYQTIESVREMMLIDADSHHAELYRQENDRWGIQLVRGAEASLCLKHGRPWDLDVGAGRGDRHPHRGCWFLTH